MSADVTTRELALAGLKRQAERMVQCVPGVLEDVDPGFLHDLRVAYRRACHLLRLFAPDLGKARAWALRRRIQGTRRLLAPLRELDVLLPRIQERLVAMGSPAEVQILLRSFMTLKRNRARHDVWVRLLDPETEADVACLEAPNWPMESKGQRMVAVRAPVLFWEAARPLHRQRRICCLDLDEADQHALRILVKRLRDTVEALDAYVPPSLGDVRVELCALQERLGRLEDLSNEIALLCHLGETRQLPERARAAARNLVREVKHERANLVVDLEAFWREQRGLWGGFRVHPSDDS